MTAPVWVRLSSVFTARAIPKSVTLTSPSGVINTFPGFTSRCTTPWRCAKARAAATPAPIVGDLDGRQRRGIAQDGRQRPAVNELHDDEVGAVVLAPVEDRHDVRVRQVGGRLRLPAEPLDEGAVDGELGEEHLEGDRPVELEVHGPVHLGHAAAGDQMRELVAARIDARVVDRLHGARSLRWAAFGAGERRRCVTARADRRGRGDRSRGGRGRAVWWPWTAMWSSWAGRDRGALRGTSSWSSWWWSWWWSWSRR